MNRVLSRDQIRAFDRYAIDACHVPGLLLMENAGRAAAELCLEMLGDSLGPALVLCGPGNNGGDGLVLARHLLSRGIAVQVWLVGDRAKLQGDALINFKAFLGLGQAVHALGSDQDFAQLEQQLAGAPLAVDALLGTGLDRPVRDPYARLITLLNEAPVQRLALDLPSGLDANTGAVLGAAVQAHQTITFGALKLGLLTPTGAALCGKLHVASLGVPASLIDHVGHEAFVVTADQVASLLGPRPLDTHKHAEGNVLVLAGDTGKTGASLLVAHGALRTGAGLVTIGTWPEAQHSLEQRVLEVMTLALEPAAIERSVDEAMQGRSALAIGPGFGTSERSRKAVEHAVFHFDGPKVLDADAITLFAGRASELSKAPGSLVLTPHPGEMARLLGIKSAQVQADRFAAVREAVKQTGATVVLKGARSIIGFDKGPLAINTADAPTLATAGSGDVLTGIIAALCTQLPAQQAALVGVHLHGRAGEAWMQSHRADRGMKAGEIADELPGIFADLLGH